MKRIIKNFIAIIIFATLLVGLTGCFSSKKISSSGNDVYCLGSKFMEEEFMKSLDTNDLYMFGLVIGDPLTIKLTDGTRVKVLQDGEPTEISVLDGIHSGRTCWITRIFIR